MSSGTSLRADDLMKVLRVGFEGVSDFRDPLRT
jgi:hypothetical protein